MKLSRLSSKISPLILIIVLISTFIFSAQPARAQLGVVDISASISRTLKSIWDKVASQILNNVLTTTINRLAYDYATYLGSGSKGQKPMFLTKNIGEIALEAGDAAFGQFLESVANGQYQIVGQDGKQILKVPGMNLCSPDLSILKRISLGISDEQQPQLKTGLCTFSDMKKAWQGEYDEQIKYILQDGNFGKRLSQSLDPGVSEVAVAWELMGQADDIKVKEMGKAGQKATENGGWLRVENLISGAYTSPPKETERQAERLGNLQTGSILKYSGNVLVDAANIFINQLAMTAFNKLMNKIGSTGDSGSSVSNNQYAQRTGGITEVERNTSQLLQANFSEKADYDILSQLVTCPNGENNPGPTDCVIDQQFSQAIEQQLTIAQAIKSGLIDGNRRIGFNDQGEDISYLDGYPYRSLVILRKYRVLPVGWEVAAQYIKTHSEETKTVTLKKLLECYEPNDDVYRGYGETNSGVTWCTGLVDPNWVLKLPKLYCGMQGYGQEIISNQIVPSSVGYCTATDTTDCSNKSGSKDCATDWRTCTENNDPNCIGSYTKCNFTVGKDVSIIRSDNYCADEQSCIKENSNGSCSNYGYCTEEQRRWKFNQGADNSCEARNNTCQTFRSDSGVTGSYLENTLDYANCGANQVGCKQYATTGVYTLGTNTTPDKMAWNVSTDSRYFNKNITDCSSSQEGCHQFIRIKDDLDANLVADGSFESSICIDNTNETYLPQNDSNPFVKTASAQLANTCTLTDFNASGTLPPDNHWYIRTKSGVVKAGVVNDKSSDGGKSLYVEGDGGLYVDNTGASILPTDFVFEADRFYTLSVNVYVESGKVGAGFGSAATAQLQNAETTETGKWQNLIVTYYRPATNGATNFYIEGTDSSAKFYIDTVKLSVGSAATSYSDYLGGSVIYEKLLPNYLEASCYKAVGSNYQLKDNAPAQCNNYVRKCNADEVGCETYTSANTGIAVTAKIKPKDLCPNSCLGYDAFVEQATYFSIKNSAYFIPSTAKECSSQAVGCTAFTNLDKLDQGGEATEYYSYLRSCIKPDVNSCSEFYTWEGSDDSGYQLRVFSLKKNSNEPASTMNSAEEALVCNETIFKKLPSDPGYNYDCREFYSRDGTVSYHLYTRTISCSDSCHPYRREVASEQECTLGGGVWEAAQTRCLYYALPGEGTSCSAAEVGCREYTGNIANNVREVVNDTFDPLSTTNPTESWNGAAISNTSLNLSEHSLLGTNLAKFVGKYDSVARTYGVKRDESYTISFLAKAQAGSNISITGIDLINKDNESAVFSTGSTTIGSDWKIYTFNLDKINHEVTAITNGSGNGDAGGIGVTIGEQLRLNFSAPVYIDNIRLTEVPNRYFLIKDSWSTPDECDQTVTGAYAPRYMLGCSQYQDRAKTTINLHSFSQLCQDSAAGCEQMIDTYNSKSYKSETYSGVTVPADKIINVVYDQTKLCNSDNKGCQRLGLATSYEKNSNPPEIQTIYADVYKNNNPDNYNQIICKSNEVGCSQWTNSTGGTAYFKDPGDMLCEWRLKKGSTTNEYKWFKKKIKRCGGLTSGSLCSKDSDCSGQTCQLDESDIPCDTTYDKTVGSGGTGNRTLQPSTWAGTCEATQAGCTEYIDPLSKFNENLVVNPSYKDFDTNVAGVDYWQDWNSGENPPLFTGAKSKQKIKIYPQTIYIIKGAGPGDSDAKIKIDCTPSDPNSDRLRVLDSDNNFSVLMSGSQPSYTTSFIAGGTSESLEFYYQSDSAAPAFCTIYRSNRTPNQTIYFRPAIVEYQKAQNLDRTSPNGLVNIDSGLILFNERAQNGSSKKSLVYNADKTYNTGVDGKSPESVGTLNSNVILKVKPDRSCAKWLSCLTYIPDPNDNNKKVCLEVGLCDKLAADGSCLNFIDKDKKQNQSNESLAGNIGNLSGYSKVGYTSGTNSATFSDYYNIASMYQVGETVEIVNGGFEDRSAGWVYTGTGAQVLNQPSQIDDLNLAPFNLVKGNNSQNSSYLVPEGKGILKLPSTAKVTQLNPISLTANGRYVITFYAYINSDGLTVDFDDITPANNDFKIEPLKNNNAVKNKWVKYSLGFRAASTSYKISFNNDNNNPPVLISNGDVYVDDVRIAPALNIRCSDPTVDGLSDCNKPDVNPKPQYVGSSCRLYARENSLACAYVDDQNIRHKGLYGYCLEPDPKNPASCLLWYPTSRIAGDQNEEAPSINWTGDVYYCVDAKDQCVGDNPQFYCNKFIKVNKDLYWNRRLADNSTFKMPDESLIGGRCSVSNNIPCSTSSDCPSSPPQTCVGAKAIFPTNPTFFPTSTRGIDFGVGGAGNIPVGSISRNTGGNGYFGSRNISTALSTKEYVTTTGGPSPSPYNINSFLPYYGLSNRTMCGGSARNLNDNDLYLGNSSGGGTSQSGLSLRGDMCKPWWAGYMDYDYNLCGESNLCKYGHIEDGPFGSKECNYPTYQGSCVGGTGSCITNADCASGVCTWGCNDGANEAYCSASDSGNGVWHDVNYDGESAGSDDTGCSYECFNIAKKYNVANSITDAQEALKRIFINRPNSNLVSPWKLYTLVGDYYDAGVDMNNINGPSPCPNKVRQPNVDTLSGKDYCYIDPVINNFKINNKEDTDIYVYPSAPYVTLSFSTKTDPEQLPIKSLTVDWGYFGSGGREKTSLGTNLADINRVVNKRLSYWDVKGDTSINCITTPGDEYCPINISIELKDNWAYSTTKVFGGTIRVYKEDR